MTLAESEIREALDHLAFEFFNLRLYRRLLRGGIKNLAYSQASCYALLVHARAIRDFFYASPQRDDVVIDHFSSWFKVGSEFKCALDDSQATWIKNQLNKRLAHLTASRWRNGHSPALDEYDFALDGLEADMQNFENALSAELRDVLSAAIERREELYASSCERKAEH